MQWGTPRDLPVPGDYDSDGSTDLAVWQPADGTWYIRKSSDPQTAWEPHWGAPGDLPVAGDYDGDSGVDLTVWRPVDGTWHAVLSLNSDSWEAQLGRAGDIPLPHLAARYTVYAPAAYGGSAR